MVTNKIPAQVSTPAGDPQIQVRTNKKSVKGREAYRQLGFNAPALFINSIIIWSCWSLTFLLTMIIYGAEQWRVKGGFGVATMFFLFARTAQGHKGARKCLYQPNAYSNAPRHILQWEELEGVGVHVKSRWYYSSGWWCHYKSFKGFILDEHLFWW